MSKTTKHRRAQLNGLTRPQLIALAIQRGAEGGVAQRMTREALVAHLVLVAGVLVPVVV
jgi:hypothetical protein